MATIKDIANRLGVSVSTVSKGLNGANDISEDLRQAVLDTAVEMGYSTKRSRKE
jgi:LacI family transcriptional regulator